MKDEDKLASRACCNKTRGNGFKLKDSRFTMNVVKHWHWLPGEVEDGPSLETCKVRLDGALRRLI